MNKKRPNKRKANTSKSSRVKLSGWWKALPLIFIPFGVIFYEAWLQTQILRAGYRSNNLVSEIRKAEDRVDRLRSETHRLGRLERMDAHAPNLGLIEPKPGQIEVVFARTRSMPYIEIAESALDLPGISNAAIRDMIEEELLPLEPLDVEP